MTMRFEVSRRGSPHNFSSTTVSGIMRDVMFALLPGTLLYAYFFGWGVISNVLLAVLFAVVFETLALHLRGRSVAAGLNDYSAPLSGWLLALALPPMSSWWLIAVGVGFAIFIAKHIYGGLGYNPFNPAMVGYVVVLISFPREMALWLAPTALDSAAFGLFDTLRIVVSGELSAVQSWPATQGWDAITRATPLDAVRTGLGQGFALGDIRETAVLGESASWTWLSLAWLTGGLWLLYRRVIAWQIPLGMLLSLAVLAGVFHLLNAELYASPLFHLLSGGTALAAFFIATDPVTAASSNKGRFVYAIGIGAFTYVIRTWGGYPDGIAFAVLLMNLCAPTIDYLIRPRAYGHKS